MSNFRVGQKVVCVNDGPHPGCTEYDSWGDGAPEVGAIYTVRRCFIDGQGYETLWLDEIQRDEWSRAYWGDDVGYGSWRFRPLVERKTDISIFTEMLNTKETPVKAGA